MKYISIAEAVNQYGVADKTIRRAIAKLSVSDRKRNIKTKGLKILVSTQWLDSVYPRQTGDNNQHSANQAPQSDATLDLLRETLKTLQNQLSEKDKQIERLDSKLDQQQKLQMNLQGQFEQLQNQLAIEAPKPAKQTKPKTSSKIDLRSGPQKPQKPKKRANPRPKTETPASEPVEAKKGLFRRMLGR